MWRVATAACCENSVPQRSDRLPGNAICAAGNTRQNKRSNTFTAIALPIMAPTDLGGTSPKGNLVGLMANGRSISLRVIRRPRVLTQWPELEARERVKQGLMLIM